MHPVSDHDVLELPMTQRTRAEKSYLAVMFLAPLAVFVFMAVGTSVPYFKYLGFSALIFLAAFITFHLATKVSHTQFDFRSKTIRRYFAHNPFRKYVDFNFDRFEVVLSEGAPRAGTVTVKLTGRNGSIPIAVFGPSETHLTNDGRRFDHPKAHELRCYVAQRLNVRNVGAL